MPLRLLPVVLLLLASAFAWAGMLDGVDEIDGQFVIPQTGQPMLNMIVDERLDSEASLKKFSQKIEYYARYASSGEMYRNLPKANKDLSVRIAIAFDRQPSESEKRAIFVARDRLMSMNFEVWLRVVDSQTRRSTELQP